MGNRVVAVTVVLVALVAGAAYFVLHRFDGGPLVYDSTFTQDELFDVGQTRTFIATRLVNTGTREVRVERVAPQWTLEHTRVEIWAARPGVRIPVDEIPFPFAHPDLGESFPPPGTTPAELRPAVGARVPGHRASTVAALRPEPRLGLGWRSPEGRRLPLLITVTALRQGCRGFGGLVVDYRNGLRRHRLVMKLAFGGHAGQGHTPRQRLSRLRRCNDVIARLADRSGSADANRARDEEARIRRNTKAPR